MRFILTALKKTYQKRISLIITLISFLIVLWLNYFIFTKNTTWSIFWESNIALYNWLQIILTVINSSLIAVSIAMFTYLISEKAKGTKTGIFQTAGSMIFSLAATGCPVCGAYLLPLLGIAASLTALPFGGLEVKVMSIFLLIYSIREFSASITDVCKIPKEKLLSFKNGYLKFQLDKKTFPQLKPFVILAFFISIIYVLPYLPASWRFNFALKQNYSNVNLAQAGEDPILAQINPPKGVEINARFGDIGPKMLAMGVIDLDKFEGVYDNAGQPLTEEQLNVLTKGSNQKIMITPQNSYFLLNFFWAFGLANKTKILTEGPMTQYGQAKAGQFASTGGFNSMTKSGNSMDYYAKEALVPLSNETDELVNKVASEIYRPCCGNATNFPDCNHGMALLGILELMASQGASETDMYQASKYINSYWFPANAYDLYLYFKNKDGKEFKDVDPRIVLNNDHFSGAGAQKVKKWLTENNLVKPPPASGGGCGV